MLGRDSAIRPVPSLVHSFGLKAAISALAGVALLLSACGGSSSTTTGAGAGSATCPQTTSLTGAGSTFDAPLFSKQFAQYANEKCNVQVNYQPVGSGSGINQLLAQTVDFGATDAPMTDSQLGQSKAGNIIHIPITLGAVAISYNLSSLPTSQHLKFTGPVIADIWLGKVKYWDDAEITNLNPGVTLPHEAMTVVHRSDGSGTTGIFTHYLAAVKSTAGAIGYNELAYVLTNTIQYGVVQNQAGEYVAPSLESAKTAAANVTTIPADLRFYIVNAPGSGSYPISGFSWVIVYQAQTSADKGQAVANMLWWLTHQGQQYSTALSYVPLPSGIVTKDEAQIKSMTCGGKACYTGLFG